MMNEILCEYEKDFSPAFFFVRDVLKRFPEKNFKNFEVENETP